MATQTPPYTIITNTTIDNQPHVKFIRIRPNNFQLTLSEIFHSLIDKSWLNRFANPVIRKSFEARVDPTIAKITEHLKNGQATAVDSDSGELVVSELSRKTVVNEFHYLDIPIAELFKCQVSQNPGFDFYSENLDNVILFGEAKYLASTTASRSALNQIDRFVSEEHKDYKDIPDLRDFVSDESIVKFGNGIKGFIAAFSSKSVSNDVIIDRIKGYPSYNSLKNYAELICVAVDL